MLVCLGLGALSVQGLIGPMNGELAATLPAHMKTFGLSLYVFFQDLLQPCYVAIMGVGLQVVAICSMSLAIAAQLLWCKILQNSCHSQSCLYCLGFLKQPVSCRVSMRITGQPQLGITPNSRPRARQYFHHLLLLVHF